MSAEITGHATLESVLCLQGNERTTTGGYLRLEFTQRAYARSHRYVGAVNFRVQPNVAEILSADHEVVA